MGRCLKEQKTLVEQAKSIQKRTELVSPMLESWDKVEARLNQADREQMEAGKRTGSLV